MDLELLQDSNRLANLSGNLNLEDHANKYRSSTASHILCLLAEYEKTKEYVQLQERICYSYGIDCVLRANHILKKMNLLVSQFSSHEFATYAFCRLKVELCFEQDQFLDEIICKVEDRLKSCSNLAEEERLIKAFFKIRNMYPNV